MLTSGTVGDAHICGKPKQVALLGCLGEHEPISRVLLKDRHKGIKMGRVVIAVCVCAATLNEERVPTGARLS